MNSPNLQSCFLFLLLALPVHMLIAGEADVLDVQIQRAATGAYRIDVTVQHADSGWDHYADRWDVLAPDGSVLGTRTLLHPHEHEQPFTRSQSGIIIPADVTNVTVRAHDLVDGFGGQEVVVDLTAVSGENFSVER